MVLKQRRHICYEVILLIHLLVLRNSQVVLRIRNLLLHILLDILFSHHIHILWRLNKVHSSNALVEHWIRDFSFILNLLSIVTRKLLPILRSELNTSFLLRVNELGEPRRKIAWVRRLDEGSWRKATVEVIGIRSLLHLVEIVYHLCWTEVGVTGELYLVRISVAHLLVIEVVIIRFIIIILARLFS